ncbi:charged multivesicular body protein 7 [Leptinotarsa decemlineata]|uniref:charged multivesicular body protein 7 n=1 Tax=Leptinotarsa decemlineata TaxID=7539 RepID=UPI003D30C437
MVRSLNMFGIPEEILPECLKDEQRINVLFAPLRNRSVNPKDWDSKISSWKTIIRSYCQANDIYTFTLSSLSNVFIRNGRPPSCLQEVLCDMHKNGEIQPLDEFSRKMAPTWTGWATDVLIKKPVVWSFNKIKNSVFTLDTSQQSFVHLEVIKSKCNDLLKSLPDSRKNKLISLKDLLTSLEKSYNQADNVKLLLHHLANQRIIEVTKLDSNKQSDDLDTFLIKFGDGNGKVCPITETDTGIYTLEQNEKVISRSLEELEDNIQACVQEAKMHLAKNHRQMAKSSLRKKHDLEKRLEKKINALQNVQNLLEKVQETHKDAHVWEAYKGALSAFDESFKNTGLSEDAIDDTMIKLGEMLDKHDDIQIALARPAQESNDADLEEELAELMREEPHDEPHDGGGLNDSMMEKQFEDLTINLPDVPDENSEAPQVEGKVATIKY